MTDFIHRLGIFDDKETVTLLFGANLDDDAGGNSIQGEDYVRIQESKGKGK